MGEGLVFAASSYIRIGAGDIGGRVKAKAFVTHSIRAGQLFMPMHYEHVNKLTHAHFDPHSRQPSYKDCAVKVRAVESWDVEAS